ASNTMWGPMRFVYLQYASDPDLFRLSELLSRNELDAAAARPGRFAAIAVVPSNDSASTGAGHAHGDHRADRPRPCLRTGALHRRMDAGDRCPRLVLRRDHAAEAAPLKALKARALPNSRPSQFSKNAFMLFGKQSRIGGSRFRTMDLSLSFSE